MAASWLTDERIQRWWEAQQMPLYLENKNDECEFEGAFDGTWKLEVIVRPRDSEVLAGYKTFTADHVFCARFKVVMKEISEHKDEGEDEQPKEHKMKGFVLSGNGVDKWELDGIINDTYGCVVFSIHNRAYSIRKTEIMDSAIFYGHMDKTYKMVGDLVTKYDNGDEGLQKGVDEEIFNGAVINKSVE